MLKYGIDHEFACVDCGYTLEPGAVGLERCPVCGSPNLYSNFFWADDEDDDNERE